jgi:2-keto-4-pentenoate hydratase
MSLDMPAMNPAADLLLSIREGSVPRPAAFPAALSPADETAAYRVQLAVLNRLGASISGWKVGLSDPTHGTSAPIPSGNVLRSPAHISDAVHRTARSERFGIEPEIAFTLKQALPPLVEGALYSREQVVAAIGAAHCAIEVCICRLADFSKAPPLDRLADSSMNEALVLGAANIGWARLDIIVPKLTIQIGGTTAFQGAGVHPAADPLNPLVWLANQLSARHIGLKSGDTVTTGSFAGIHYANAGQRVRVEIEGIGTATIEF